MDLSNFIEANEELFTDEPWIVHTELLRGTYIDKKYLTGRCDTETMKLVNKGIEKDVITTALRVSGITTGIPLDGLSISSIKCQASKTSPACVLMSLKDLERLEGVDISGAFRDIVVSDSRYVGVPIVAIYDQEVPMLLPKGLLQVECHDIVDNSDEHLLNIESGFSVGIKGYKFVGEENPTYHPLFDRDNWIEMGNN